MNYYTADTHFCHARAISYDGRPWDDVDAMEADMIERWNRKVGAKDDVYIIGDFCFGHAENWRRILPQLSGRKHLVKGNHDLRKYPDDILAMLAEPPAPMMFVRDNGHKIVMSHNPMISYNNDSDPQTLMFYGHVHTTIEFGAVKEAVKAMKERCRAEGFDYQGNLYNCWCGFFDWAPATLGEVLANEGARSLAE